MPPPPFELSQHRRQNLLARQGFCARVEVRDSGNKIYSLVMEGQEGLRIERIGSALWRGARDEH
jgi:hypothetical protein